MLCVEFDIGLTATYFEIFFRTGEPPDPSYFSPTMILSHRLKFSIVVGFQKAEKCHRYINQDCLDYIFRASGYLIMQKRDGMQ